ncbi:MAG: phenylacetate--CoA ligase, partial [Clostridiales Family XIII bacterium]|nr:phenylacetate--CoA ligase [Clostridiales Family XIII bacterium]
MECADREVMRAIQNERLAGAVRRAYDNVAPYRAKCKEKGVEPGDIASVDDLHKLPFLSKDDLRDAYPYGYLAAPLGDCVRIQSTSGTTGKR